MEIYAASILYKRPCIVYVMDKLIDRMFLDHYSLLPNIAPLKLSYEGKDHYNVLMEKTLNFAYLQTEPGVYELPRIREEAGKTSPRVNVAVPVATNAQLQEIYEKKVEDAVTDTD